MIGDMEFTIDPVANNRGLVVHFSVEKTHFSPKQIIEREETIASLEKRQSPSDEDLDRLRSLKKLGESVEIELVELRQIGSDYHTAVVPVDDAIRERFPKEYEAFKAGESLVPDGLLLSDWGMVPKKVVDELAEDGVETVEQLSSIADSDLGKFLPFQNARKWRDQALKYLNENSGRLADMASTVKSQAAEMIALKARLEDLEHVKGKKHG